MNNRIVFLLPTFTIVSLFALSLHPMRAFPQSPLEADAIALRYDSTHAEVDIYYGVLQRALVFTQKGDLWTAVTSSKAEVWQNGSVVQHKDIHDTVRFQGTRAQYDSAGAEKLLGAMGFAVPYSSSTRAVFIWQQGASVFDTIVIPVFLPDRDNSKFSFSGVELGSNVSKSTGTPSPFEHAGVIVTPNPSAVFGENYTKLYYYTELYVPVAYTKLSESADVISEVIDGSGNVVLSSTEKVPLAGQTIPLALGLDIDGLSSDAYKIRIKAKVEEAVQAEAEKSFYYSSGMKLSEEAPPPASSLSNDSVLFAESDFAKLTDATVDEVVEQSMYWGSEPDQQVAKKLHSLSEKEHFLFTFWRDQDAIHHSAQSLDAYRTFKQRVEQANKDYTYQKTPGWKTGRGRVLITYGPPPSRNIQSFLFIPGYKPYIIWTYDPDPNLRLSTGNYAEFDFVDRMGGGNFYLVSSNVIGETYDPNWKANEAMQLAH